MVTAIVCIIEPVFKKAILLLLIFSLASGYLAFYKYQKYTDAKRVEKGVLSASTTPDYLIILVGDSMTEYLGNGTELRGYLAEDYPNKTFDIYNYGFGSTNILSLPDRLTKTTEHGRPFAPILSYKPAVIIIESFGYNPLSQFPILEGLQKQNEALDQSIKLIKDSTPDTKIIFMATISPNIKKYGQGSVDLSPEKRKEWAEERIAYIKNHIAYANSHNIPVINVFERSKNLYGDGNLEYIEDKTYIHPSPKGIVLIQKEIADFIHRSKIL